MSSERLLRSLVAAVAGLILAAPAAGAQTTVPAFYDPPAALPATDGAVVRSASFAANYRYLLPGLRGALPGSAQRLMYTTTATAGDRAAVTGAFLRPWAPWRGEGPRPVVVVAPGTQGQGDTCAPSLLMERGITVTESALAINYEALAVYRLLRRGVAVVVTDYVGLGTTDRVHTYVNRVDEGHAVLDAARAALRLPGSGLDPDSPVGVYGYSQGGGAAASAAELQPAYAPELRLRGVYAGAPVADLRATLEAIDGTSLTAAVGWAVNGFVQTYPQLRGKVAALTNADGQAALDRLSGTCTGNGLLRYAFQRSSRWTTDGRTLSQVVDADPELAAIVDAQRIGRGRPTAPVRIVSGTKDDFVPHAQARQLAADWCAQGADVSWAPIEQPRSSGGLGLNHALPIVTQGPAAADWLTARLAGEPVTPACPAAGSG